MAEAAETMRETWATAEQLGSEQWLDYWYENVWDEQIDYRAIEGAVDDRGPIHGRDEMRAYLADWFATVDDFTVTPEQVIDAGDGVAVARVRLSGRMHGSEQWIEQHLAVVWTFRDGKLVRGREYSTLEEALSAAGVAVSGE